MDRDKGCRALEECPGLLSAVLGRHSVRVLRERQSEQYLGYLVCSTFRGWQSLAVEEARALVQPFAARPVLRQIVAPPLPLHFA